MSDKSAWDKATPKEREEIINFIIDQIGSALGKKMTKNTERIKEISLATNEGKE